MIVLGLHGGVTLGQHDPAAVIIQDGNILVACEEERFLRVKSPYGTLPSYSIRAALKDTGLTMKDVHYVAHAGATYEDYPARLRLYLEREFGHVPEIVMVNHQTAHLASAFFGSGFDRAAVLSYDGYGDRLSASLAKADCQRGIQILETRPADQSLGVFYSLMTSFLGFMPDEDEYKVMGLAPYGQPKYDLSDFIHPTQNGFFVNQAYIDRDPPFKTRFEPWYGTKLKKLLGPPRSPNENVDQRIKDIAASTQYTLEQCALSLVRYLLEITGENKLCLAGGVALNCTLNGLISRNLNLEKIFVQPAASDRGLALGSALYVVWEMGSDFERRNICRPLDNAFLGPLQNEETVEKALKMSGLAYKKLEDPSRTCAELLSQGKVCGWFQGRSEYGPRALGHRSILADPRNAKMKDIVNLKIKFRESFRPFAPCVLEERASEVFDMKYPLPFMTLAVPVRDSWHDRLQATTHVNGTARVQSININQDERFYRVVKEFEAITGVPAVLNTSFNVKGQPIVESGLDALGTFAASGIDAVILDSFLVEK